MKNEILNDIKNIKTNFKTKNYQKELANILTGTRLLSPFILIPLFYHDKIIFAIIMIILFSLTDTFDGYFARKYNNITLFGAYLDAFVDKIFALTIIISLMIKTSINYSFYLLVITCFLELLIGFINIYSFFKDLKPTSTKIGKFKTIILFTFLSFLFLSKLVFVSYKAILLFNIITIILQIVTIISYFLQIKKRKLFKN